MGQANINSTELKGFLIPLPPLEIQNQIVEHLNKIKSEIKLLRKEKDENRRSALENFENEIFN